MCQYRRRYIVKSYCFILHNVHISLLLAEVYGDFFCFASVYYSRPIVGTESGSEYLTSARRTHVHDLCLKGVVFPISRKESSLMERQVDLCTLTHQH